ncbi:E3 ubiquitin-protein ligase XIAP-like [Argopecten irradians]|uniref:E3 ubiquitin-protein ligase XIAP-like n=1 Tax=Argopecten irradians TaxID=31199 RepID=UPI00371E05BD
MEHCERGPSSINVDNDSSLVIQKEKIEIHSNTNITMRLTTSVFVFELCRTVDNLFFFMCLKCVSFTKTLASTKCIGNMLPTKYNRRKIILQLFYLLLILYELVAFIISNRKVCRNFAQLCVITDLFKDVNLSNFTSKNHNVHITENIKTMDVNEYKESISKGKDTISWLWDIRPRQVLCNVFPSSLKQYFENAQNRSENTYPPMNIEWLRLNSFARVRVMNVRPIQLSRAGFYYNGTSDEVQCYSCGVRRSNWSVGDDPFQIHKQISPKCKHVLNIDTTNDPIPRDNDTTHSIPARQESVSEERVGVGRPVRESDLVSSGEGPVDLRDMLHHRTERQHENHSITSVGIPDISQENPSLEQTENEINPGLENISNTLRPNVSQEIPTTRPSTVQGRTRENNLYVQSEDHFHCDTLTPRPNENSSRQRNPFRGSHVDVHTDSIFQSNARVPPQTIPANQTRLRSPGVTSSLSTDTVRDSVKQKLIPLGINFDKPKFPAYSVLTVRISSYRGWSGSQRPKVMAEAGFVYAGFADYTRCFFCGGGLKNWEDGDDPWIEHARWFPNCVFLKQNKGVEFVQLVHEGFDSPQQVNNGATTAVRGQAVGERVSSEEFLPETNVDNLPAFQGVIQKGHSPARARQVIALLMAKGMKSINESDVLEEINGVNGGVSNDDLSRGNKHIVNIPNSSDQEEGELRDLVEENRRLKREMLCRICEEENASVTFLPCAHLMCCQVCAKAMRRCPVCRTTIQGMIKTFLT